MQTVRKDCLPEETILKIKNILLNKLNLSVKESHICNNDKIHSVRLEMSNIPLGTNGKGVSPSYALASAYGEFIERLQGGFLIEPCIGDYYTNKVNEEIISNKNDIKIFLKENFLDLCSDISTYDVESLLSIKNNMFHLDSIYDVFKSQTTELPVNMISALCGSNGLCAGNTPYEAICQGIGELFERYVVKEIISSRFVPLKIKRELYYKLPIYEMIKYVEEKGYICEIYNCTLNGKLPVIGVVIFNHLKTKKVFALGADINFEIAIQRCITEIFQGKVLNLSFQSTMTDLINLNILDENWDEINSNLIGYQMQKHFLKGNGDIPLGFLINDDFSTMEFLNVFKCKMQTNKEFYDNYLKIIKLNNWKLFIKDYSFLGFPTYRIFIPNISSLYDNISHYLNINLLKNDLKKELKKNVIQYEKVIEILSEINSKSDLNSFISLNDILHISNPNNIINTHLLELVLLYINNDFKNLYDKYLLYNKGSENNFLGLFFHALANGRIDNEIKSKFQGYNSNSKLIDDFLYISDNIKEYLYTCKDCDYCTQGLFCYTPQLIEVYKQLYNYKKEYIENYKF